jgi:hypothetical protein
LIRLGRIKVALIERVSAIGTLDRPVYENVRGVRKVLDMIGRGELPQRIDPLATMPPRELERTAEALRRALPELTKLDRYESRAAARRDKALREITRRR